MAATSRSLAAPTALRRRTSMARLRAAVVSHAPGRPGIPSRGQRCRASANASCAHSSARSQSPVVLISVATTLPHSSRNAEATAASTADRIASLVTAASAAPRSCRSRPPGAGPRPRPPRPGPRTPGCTARRSVPWSRRTARRTAAADAAGPGPSWPRPAGAARRWPAAGRVGSSPASSRRSPRPRAPPRTRLRISAANIAPNLLTTTTNGTTARGPRYRPYLITVRPRTHPRMACMSITRDEVAHLARLARISLSDAELDHLAPQLDQIITSVAQVQEVGADGIPPTSQATGVTNVFRDDVPVPCLTPEQALDQAPAVEQQRFKVPRILGEY